MTIDEDDDDPSIPDVFDLNDWLYDTNRTVWDVLRYVTYSSFYTAALNIWRQAGSPNIRT